ncbi:serpin family protein [Streptomyces sp. NBC_01537]|uniref:serpin family protein n=1 Tax=Streptomyces sp. NBC_01537 TaxID=2903896 RepID=UPI00386C0BE7
MRTETNGIGSIMALGELWLELLFDDPVIRGGREDVICSPAGLWLALAAMQACADGATREELRGVVGPVGAEHVAGCELGRGGAFIAATRLLSRLPVRPEFRMPWSGFAAAAGFGAGVGVGHPGPDSPHDLHQWVLRSRNGPLDHAAAGVDPAPGALLVNAVALEAEWEQPFDPYFTREFPFTDAQGVTHHVPAMVGELPVEDAWTVTRPHGRVTVVELRARARGGAAEPTAQPVRVRFALSENREVPPAAVIAASWAPAARGREVRGSRGSRHPEAVLLELPRHSLAGHVDVTPHLAALGVERLFSPSAELPRMFAEPVHCDRALQSCLIQIGEEGMRSKAAADDTEDPDRANRMYFDGPGQLLRTVPVRLDRPFAVSVLDESGTIPLLGGYQAGPPVYPQAAHRTATGPQNGRSR